MFYLYNRYLCFSRTSRRVETCGYPKEDKQWRSSFSKKKPPGSRNLPRSYSSYHVLEKCASEWSALKPCALESTQKLFLQNVHDLENIFKHKKKRNNRKHRKFSLLWWFCYCVCDENQINPGRNLSWKLIREYSISMQSITREQKEKRALFRLSITGDFPPASFGGQRRGNAIETHY